MNISLPDEITAAMTRGVARGVEEGGYVRNIGDVNRLQQVRAADAMLAAANNPGGGVAGAGVQAGLGVALGAQMAGQFAGGMAPQAAPAAAPPPLPSAGPMFHVDAGGQPSGPFSVAQLQDAAMNGRMTGQSLVWSAGMAGWTSAAQVPALAHIFAVPPPLPPAAPPPGPPGPPAAPNRSPVTAPGARSRSRSRRRWSRSSS